MKIRPLTPISYPLARAVELLSADVQNFQDINFSGITHKDSDIEDGDIFLAFPGEKVHGAQFISRAQERGAVAVLTDSAGAQLSTELPTIIVKSAREAGALLAANFYGDPTRNMQSIGITGTNGKTTVTTLLYQIFSSVGRESGLIGTVESRIGQEVIKSERTTPEAPELQALAASMVERHMRHLVMEVSSHSVELKRLLASHFSIVGFTNLSQDHLDFHKDMESYFAAKSKLFTFEYAEKGFINIDNEFGARLAESASIPVSTISRSATNAQWHYTEIVPTTSGSECTIRGRDGILIQTRTPMHGGFNLDNLLMAVAIAYECEVDPLEIASIVPQLTGAPGRLESINLGQGYKAFVDYAHSPDAVTNVLAAVKEFTPGRVIAVLGCGGDRDSSKRPLMGRALHEGSDISIFTSDNPRSESPQLILSQMTEGLSISTPSSIIEDRAEAIRYAVSLADEDDTVIILGKGHESGQDINGTIMPFDDRIHLAEAIEAKP